MNFSIYNYLNTLVVDQVKQLFLVKFSDAGSNFRKEEEQTWIHFIDFLDECEGKYKWLTLQSCYTFFSCRG